MNSFPMIIRTTFVAGEQVAPEHAERIKDCERCGFTYYEYELSSQGGLWVCDECWDEPIPAKRLTRSEDG
jgi:formylmethanofuran dehydrogenase subunit E